MIRFLAVVLLCVGCGGTTIDAGGYDRSCQNGADCVPVYQGDGCAPCLCTNAAVSSSASGSYESALASLVAKCPAKTAMDCNCVKRIGLCTSGRCSARPE